MPDRVLTLRELNRATLARQLLLERADIGTDARRWSASPACRRSPRAGVHRALEQVARLLPRGPDRGGRGARGRAGDHDAGDPAPLDRGRLPAAAPGDPAGADTRCRAGAVRVCRTWTSKGCCGGAAVPEEGAALLRRSAQPPDRARAGPRPVGARLHGADAPPTDPGPAADPWGYSSTAPYATAGSWLDKPLGRSAKPHELIRGTWRHSARPPWETAGLVRSDRHEGDVRGVTPRSYARSATSRDASCSTSRRAAARCRHARARPASSPTTTT